MRAYISAVRGLTKPLKVAILCMISNKKISIFIAHFSLKVQREKTCSVNWTNIPRLGDFSIQSKEYRVDALHSADVLSQGLGQGVHFTVSFANEGRMLQQKLPL